MKRVYELTHLLLMMISTIGVIGATCAEPATLETQAVRSGDVHHRPAQDRRFTDLARFDRRSRESRQRKLGRAIGSVASEISRDAV